jgi:Ca2+-binding RTX toxin-like protein
LIPSTPNSDIITGTSADDVIAGKAGNDQLSGQAGSDTLVGGTGSDVLDGGDSNDLLIGGQGDAGQWQVSQSGTGELLLHFTPNNPELAENSGLNLKGNFTINTLPMADSRFSFVEGSAALREAVSNLYLALTQRLPELSELSQWTSMGFNPTALYDMAGNAILAPLGGGATGAQKSSALFNTIWGAGAASAELLKIGADFFNAGGSLGLAVQVLAQLSPLRQQLTDANGDIRLVRTATLGDSGWGLGDGGDVLTGGAGNDTLVGGGGGDALIGGEGTDTGVWSGRVKDFKVAVVGLGADSTVALIDTRLGTTDTIDSIEILSIAGQQFGAMPLQSVDAVRNYLATHTDHSLEVVLIGLGG